MSARSSAKNQLPDHRRRESRAPQRKALSQIIERGTRVQAPAIKAYVDRLRNAEPNATPAEIVTRNWRSTTWPR